MSVGERLKAAIDGSGMSMVKFSEQTGIAYRTLQQYVAGDRQPGAEGLAKISAHSSVDVNWLLTGEGEMYRAPPAAPALSPEEAAVLALYRQLDGDARREIQTVAEEKKRLREVESQLQEMRRELASLKRLA
jgi:transcriptional regulator with XRE-family HTH domain